MRSFKRLFKVAKSWIICYDEGYPSLRNTSTFCLHPPVALTFSKLNPSNGLTTLVISPVPELSFLPVPKSGGTQAGERRV